MQDNQDLGLKCIVDSINKQVKIDSITSDCKCNVKDKAILIEQMKALKKAVHNISSYSNTIAAISDKSIIISANNGSVKTIIRS
jgi:hypothetical protein